jgi:MYXO-CTERM domain-containing protein
VDDEVQPCGTAEGECRAGWQQCDDGAWLECQGAVSPVAEACNGRDDDCDGTIDDGATCAPGFACVDGTCVDDGGQVSDFGATGCGCVVPGRSGSPFAALLAALCLAPAVRRRRAGR